jgi:TolB protein
MTQSEIPAQPLAALNSPRFAISRRGLAVGAAALILPHRLYAQTATLGATSAPADSAIIVDRARIDPIPVAIPAFNGSDAATQRLGADISGVITNNLARSGLFRAIDQAAFIGQTTSDVPVFANWKGIGAQALVTGKVESQGGNKLRVEFRLWDVLPGTQIQGTAYSADTTNWRRIAHIISDVIYERLLGEKGYFDTHVVYIAGSGPRDRRVKRLALMDQDGENNRFLTDGTWIAKTPRFHPSQNKVAFMSFANQRPRVYMFDLDTQRQSMLGDFPGMTLSPRFAPDGNSVIMAQSTPGGNADIFSVDLATRRSKQLTNSGSIDVSPCFSPDGAQVCFNSDRGGDQQLYVMNADGSNQRRISFGKGRYATPVWSPRGDLIAFTKFSSSAFSIGVMRPDGSGERILSESYYVEGPTFAPNGRVIMFWRETPARDNRGTGFSARLVSIDITGFNERQIPTPTDASEPAWGPLLA